MSVVNADITELLQVAHNMQNVINNIEATKSMINTRYQQLGADWDDKKYKELGIIIRDCNNALNSILKTICQGVKVISLLAKSLQEYENIVIGGGSSSNNASIQNADNATDLSGRTPATSNFSRIATNGGMPDGYREIISARREMSEKNVSSIFDNYASQLKIRDSAYPTDQTPHYSPRNRPDHQRGVYYNAQADANNPRGAGTTYFHELAHMIDHAATGYQGNFSNTEEFRQALIDDGQRIQRCYNNLSQEDQNNFMNSLRANHQTHSIQDLLDATTNGEIHAGWSHSSGYWRRPGNLQAEAFAHFFEASMGSPDKLELLSRFFPTSFRIFSTMIEELSLDLHT